MTYKFKLSARMALLRSPFAALLALSSACIDGDMSSLSPYDRVAGTAKLTAQQFPVSRFDRAETGRSKSHRNIGTPDIQPNSVSLAPGESVRFALSARKASGTTQVMWTATGGTISQDGNYIAGSAGGAFLAIGTNVSTGTADTAEVIVILPGAVRHIVRMIVAPATAVVVAGGVQQFVASAEYEDGTIAEAPASFKTSGGGTITPDGRFTAGTTAGTFSVTATGADSIATGQASVAVSTANASLQQPLRVTSPMAGTNEPTGYTRITEMRPAPSSTGVRLGCNTATIVGCWWAYGSGLSVRSDATAPSGGDVLELTYPAGMQPGSGHGMFGGWAQAPAPLEYREVYESGWFKIPSADFETQMVGVKLWGYWGVGSPSISDNPVQLYMILQGNEAVTAPMSSWKIWFAQQNGISWRAEQNVNTGKLVRANTWHHYELAMKVNDIGASNGVMKVWIDGVQALSYQNILFRDSANPTGFFGRKWDPIWGGSGGAAKSRTDHLWVNSVYISGLKM